MPLFERSRHFIIDGGVFVDGNQTNIYNYYHHDGEQYRHPSDPAAALEYPVPSAIMSNAPGPTADEPRVRMFGSTLTILSDEMGGSTLPVEPFIDAADDIDPNHSIAQITISAGWVVGGIEIVYRLKSGGTRTISHGTRNNRNTTKLLDTEYVSAFSGKAGFARRGEPCWGDCIHLLEFEVTDSATGEKRTSGPYGIAYGLADSETQYIKWTGRLFAFAGRTTDVDFPASLRSLAFVSYMGGQAPSASTGVPSSLCPESALNQLSPFSLQLEVSDEFGGKELPLEPFIDASNDIDPDRPIAQITVGAGWVISGIEVVYRLKNGGTRTIGHGNLTNMAGNTTKLSDTEYVSAFSGKAGFARRGESCWGDCIHLLEFEVTDSVTGAKRTAGPYGIAFNLAPQETQHIRWTGRLFAFGGSAISPYSTTSLRRLAFFHAPRLESGIYTICNAKFKYIAALHDGDDESGVVTGFIDNKPGEKWEISLLSNKRYRIMNHSYGSFAKCASKGDYVTGSQRGKKDQWIIEGLTVMGQYTISCPSAKHLFWGLEEDDIESPVILATVPSDPRNQWIFTKSLV